MPEAKKGDSVKIHYTGKFDDGEIFDSSKGREPLEFTLGSGQVIPGFDTAVEGMQTDEEKTVRIPAAEAYGEINPNLVHEVERTQIPDDIPLEVGGQLQVQGQDGRAFSVTVVELDDTKAKLDANHPLAGKDLTFELQLVS
jgi:peptidylprolyl isomerase